MKKLSFITTLVLTALFALAAPLFCYGQAKPTGKPAQLSPEKQWAQFRGLNAAGVCEQAPPAQFGPAKNVRWKIAAPVGHSSPVIWGEHLFLSGYDPAAKTLLALAYHAKTGKQLWQRVIPAEGVEKTHQVSNPATSTPATDGERVYFYFGSAGLFAFKPDGTPVWNFPFPVAETSFGSGTSPVVAGELVVLNRDEKAKAILIAVNRRSGKEVWRFVNKVNPAGPGGQSYATPVVWNGNLVLHRRDEVVAHSLADGKRVWWMTAPSSGAATPLVSAEALYVATWSNFGEADQFFQGPAHAELLAKHDKNSDGVLSLEEFPADLPAVGRPGLDLVASGPLMYKRFGRLLDPNNDSQVSSDEWAAAQKQVASSLREHGMLAIAPGATGDATLTHVRWKEGRSVPEVPSPALLGEQVFMIRNGGVLTAMNRESGKVVYRSRINADGPYYASLVTAGGLVIASSGEGKVTVIRPGAALEVTWQVDFGEPIFATPAFAGGLMYLRTGGHLYAFATAPPRARK